MKIGSGSNSETSGEVDDMCINFSFEKLLLTQAVETEKNTNISTIFQIQLFFHVQRLEIDLQQELALFCTLWFVLWVSPSHAHREPIFLFLCTLLLLQIRNKASYFSSCTACHIVVRNTCTAKRESFVHHQYVTLQFLGKDDFQSLEQHKLQSSSYNLGFLTPEVVGWEDDLFSKNIAAGVLWTIPSNLWSKQKDGPSEKELFS